MRKRVLASVLAASFAVAGIVSPVSLAGGGGGPPDNRPPDNRPPDKGNGNGNGNGGQQQEQSQEQSQQQSQQQSQCFIVIGILEASEC